MPIMSFEYALLVNQAHSYERSEIVEIAVAAVRCEWKRIGLLFGKD